MDGRKGTLKITLNWSKFIKYRGRDLLMGNKRCKYLQFLEIYLSCHSIEILSNLTNINEIEYMLS